MHILGKNYYINIDEIIKKCRPDYGTQNFDEKKFPIISENGETILEINAFKYELFKSCIERVLSEYPENTDDDILGAFTEKPTSTSFNIAFNTLLKYEILNEYDDE